MNISETGEINNAFEHRVTMDEFNIKTEPNAAPFTSNGGGIFIGQTAIESGDNLSPLPSYEDSNSHKAIAPEKKSCDDENDEDDDLDDDDCCELNKRCAIILFVSLGLFILLLVSLFVALGMLLKIQKDPSA